MSAGIRHEIRMFLSLKSSRSTRMSAAPRCAVHSLARFFQSESSIHLTIIIKRILPRQKRICRKGDARKLCFKAATAGSQRKTNNRICHRRVRKPHCRLKSSNIYISSSTTYRFLHSHNRATSREAWRSTGSISLARANRGNRNQRPPVRSDIICLGRWRI